MKAFLAALLLFTSAHAQNPPTVGTQDYVLCSSGVTVASPADTNENVLATCNIPAGAIGPNGSFRVTLSLAMTSSGNNKVPRIRLGGFLGTAVASNTYVGSSQAQFVSKTFNRGAQNSQYTMNSTRTTAGVSNGTTTSTIDTSLPQPIVITCQKALGSETCSLTSFFVELFPRQ